ncbi:MAG TPA: AMP-binding protein, partial [Acidimicrobiia bacterium]|nr:AMP-binding protein [Acidimicrobiia bacterium]
MEVLPGLTFADVLREQRRSRPEQLAVVDGDFGRDVRLTYPELDDRTNRLANALAAAGVGHGDRILWLGQNSFRIVEALAAAAKLGAMFCPANWRQSADELAFVLGDVDARVVIWQDEEIGATVRAARELAGSSAVWLQHDADGDASYEAFLTGASKADPAVDVDPSAALLLIYTAAFSGRPNGAMLSHTALITQGIVMGRLSDIDADYVYLNSGP